MIHYNPEEHHDKLVLYIANGYHANCLLDHQFMAQQNDGTPVFSLYTGKNIYLFHNPELHRKLFLDADKLSKKLGEQGDAVVEQLLLKGKRLLVSVPKKSRREFYQYLSDNPWEICSSKYDELEYLNEQYWVWIPLCKEPIPVGEIKRLRKTLEPLIRSRILIPGIVQYQDPVLLGKMKYKTSAYGKENHQCESQSE
jgi:hypothetical protein